MRILIVEDEQIAAEYLARMLGESGRSIQIAGTCDSVSSAVQWLGENKVDLIFMDIQLGDDLCFSIFNQVEVKAPVIFTTAFNQYAIRAFKVNSIDYLLKPIEKKDLEGALTKFEALTSIAAPDYSALLEALQTRSPEFQKRFMVATGNKIRAIETTDIACFFAEGRYVSMLVNDGSRHITDYTLDKLESILDPHSFFRINRSIIVHFPFIQQMHSYSKIRIRIDLRPVPGFDVIVSIDRTPEFKKWLNR